jgi:hypothetical protein
MNIQRYAQKDIALQQIETALDLYFRQADLFSVITLAGAAEEILGRLLAERAGAAGFAATLGSIFKILRPGSQKKEPKEGLAGQELGGFVHMDPLQEAVFLLGRAIEDYVALVGTPSPGMLKFLSEKVDSSHKKG